MTDQAQTLAAAQTAASVTLRFADAVEKQLDVAPGQLVLDAAIEAGLALSYQCRPGSCTSCIARLSAGEADMRPGSSSLMPSEKAAGQRLLCLTEAQTDCAFDLPYGSTSVGAATKAHAFINAVEHLASDVVRLELELAEGDWLDFKPGQFIQLEIPGTGESRSYSIASTPADLPKIDLLIRLLPDGLTSNWLRAQARADDTVALAGPYGSFFLRPAPATAPQLMIAGGTGLAPMLSMIDTLRTKPGRKPRIILSFGCASADQLFHQDALELRSQWMPGLETRLCIDRVADGGTAPEGIRLGNPVAAMLETPLDPASTAYLCGPPAMVTAARDALIAAGLAPENIHAEQFVASH
jgi:benzoate/toluate 1,2-dioxygenase reductase subunit